jgi:cation/acetate symporter
VGGLMGLVSSVAFVILGPTLWVTILGNERPVFPYEFPAIFSMTIAFAGVILVSLTDRSAQAAKDREKFEALYLDIYLGKSIKEAAD